MLTPINEPHPGPGHTGVSGHWAVPGVPLPCAASPLALGALAGPASLWALRGGSVCRSDSEHRCWKPCEVDAEADGASVSEALRSRCTTSAGQSEPVQHRCRAPRPDGQLCARQDRLKVGLAWGARGGRGRAGLQPAGTRTPRVGTGLGLHLSLRVAACVVLSPLCAGPGVHGGGLTTGCPPCLAPSRCTRGPCLVWRVLEGGEVWAGPPQSRRCGGRQPVLHQNCSILLTVPFPREDHPERRRRTAPPRGGQGQGAEAAAAEASWAPRWVWGTGAGLG